MEQRAAGKKRGEQEADKRAATKVKLQLEADDNAQRPAVKGVCVCVCVCARACVSVTPHAPHRPLLQAYILLVSETCLLYCCHIVKKKLYSTIYIFKKVYCLCIAKS